MVANTSNYAQNVDFVMILIVSISVVLLLGITFTMIYFLIKYNHKKNKNAAQIKSNTLLEVIWIVVPLIIVMVFFYYGYVVFMEGRNIPKGAMEIQVEARMWSWKFTYPNGKVTDTLFVPQGKDIVFKITSVDVVHSFYLPAFRVKEDAVSYKPTKMFIHPKEIGSFDVACAEYCGMNHSLMYTKMYVIPFKDYEKWYKDKLTTEEVLKLVGEVSPTNEIETGKFDILASKGCMQCHSLNGDKLIGPSFTDLSQSKRKVKIDGKEVEVIIDEDYISKSITNPSAAITLGYERVPMPDQMGLLNDDELKQVVKILMNNFAKKQ
ncbi:MAG: cytochrome c oxidase subunit II [Ignavibacteria bacterium GWF2_33_9]|nr:MAG: cytochrome c oxidase subunit II [Ignavibacteria bacterium GWF2_33_9]